MSHRKTIKEWLDDPTLTTPKIELADGTIVYGFQCWWEAPLEREVAIGDKVIVHIPNDNRTNAGTQIGTYRGRVRLRDIL